MMKSLIHQPLKKYYSRIFDSHFYLFILKYCAILAMHCDGKTLASVDESGWVTVWNIEVNNQLLFSKKLQVSFASVSLVVD